MLQCTNMLKELDLSKTNLKKFGRTMAFCLEAIGLILLLRHKPLYTVFWSLGLIFFILAQAQVSLLKPIYKIWMGLAFCLGWVNTRIILILVHYLIVTPIGLMLRLFRKDILNLKLEKGVESYWLKRELKNSSKESYEKIF